MQLEKTHYKALTLVDKFINRKKRTKNIKSRPAPRGGIRGRAPPNHCLCPPNENCVPQSVDCARKKLTGSLLLEGNSKHEIPKTLVITPSIGEKELFFRRFCNKDLFLWSHPKICGISGKVCEAPFFWSLPQIL